MKSKALAKKNLKRKSPIKNNVLSKFGINLTKSQRIILKSYVALLAFIAIPITLILIAVFN